jgi:membrane protein DedA with SNARE-associated domain
VGWAAVLASQGQLNIFVVLIVAVLGAEADGLAGYGIGDRWGRKLLDRPGRWRERRQKAVARAEALYAKWGRLAVFFTSTRISGMLRMKYSQFVVWNFVAARPAGC